MEKNESKWGNFFTIILMVMIGMTFLLAGSYKLYSYISFRSGASPTIGTVEKAGIGKYLGSRPFIVYTDQNGDSHEFRSEINYYWFFSPRRDEPIDLLFLSHSPDSVLTDSYLYYLLVPSMLFIIGIITLFSAIRTLFR